MIFLATVPAIHLKSAVISGTSPSFFMWLYSIFKGWMGTVRRLHGNWWSRGSTVYMMVTVRNSWVYCIHDGCSEKLVCLYNIWWLQCGTHMSAVYMMTAVSSSWISCIYDDCSEELMRLLYILWLQWGTHVSLLYIWWLHWATHESAVYMMAAATNFPGSKWVLWAPEDVDLLKH